MREVVLDTETTGLDPNSGHRIVEIGCVELINHVASGKVLQHYLNPERDMPIEAERIHGLSNAFLKDKPCFADIVAELMAFIEDAPLVIHNAAFDLGFLNMELTRCGQPTLGYGRAIDTVALARRHIPPGAPASLDALCRRFSIDNTARELHGALLDAKLLAEVYLTLLGGRQATLALDQKAMRSSADTGQITRPRAPRPHAPSDDEAAAHAAFIATIPNAIWNG